MPTQRQHHGNTEPSGHKPPGTAARKPPAEPSSSAEGDLAAREYRDEEGNVHHHTREYMRRHGGERATLPSSGAGGEAAAPDTEPELAGESGEPEEELDVEVDALLALAQMDSDAAAAYDAAMELVDAPEISDKLRDFAADHRRHIQEIGQLLEQVGADAETAAPPPEDSTFAMFVSALGPLGTRAVLLALISSEQFTNATYETALEFVSLAEARPLLERSFADEQRHITWLSEQTRDAEDTEALLSGDN